VGLYRMNVPFYGGTFLKSWLKFEQYIIRKKVFLIPIQLIDDSY